MTYVEFQFIGLTVQVIQWYKKNAIFLEGKNMNSSTEFACLERLTFYTFVGVTTCRTIRFIQSLRCYENACLI